MKKENVRGVLVGQSGFGKSHTMKHSILPAWRRVLVLDPVGEYGRHVEAQVESAAEARDWLLHRGAGHASRPFRLACLYLDREEALAYLRVAWCLPDVLVVVEEVDQLASASHAPRELRQLVQRGRHRRISTVCATQRPADTPMILRSQANLLVAHRLTIRGDVQAMEPYLGADVAAELPELEVGERRVVDRCDAGRWGISF